MQNKSVFLLEDDEDSRAAFQHHFEAVGFIVNAAGTLEEGIRIVDTYGADYVGCFLDMRLPLKAGEEPSYNAGLRMKEHLINKGVNQTCIYIMSTGVYDRDKSAAAEYRVSPDQIVAKEYLTERRIRELLLKS